LRTSASDTAIIDREERLRAWFTRGADPILRIIDGLDIGWGGVQRWATACMPAPAGPHLDFACGYGTFLAQLGWRFPGVRLVGLNIDYRGPHALIGDLLSQAGVTAELIQADARRMPFADKTFSSASCFLGLQDIEIGFGEAGMRAALAEATRSLRPGGALTLMDEFPMSTLVALLEELPLVVVERAERALDVRWDRHVAKRAISLYATGWAAQARPRTAEQEKRVHEEAYRRMAAEMEHQLLRQGHYIPFGPMRLLIARKDGREGEQRECKASRVRASQPLTR
jgi:SAM-dependent methyltransferase